MRPVFPSAIQEWRNDTYDALDPSRPEVSMAGKKIIITGGGTGIGRATVEAFAAAKAASIFITGRRVPPLEETKKHVESKYGVPVHVFPADVTDPVAMKKVATDIGQWDVLVNNAGYFSGPALAKDSNLEEWWKGFEINIKGTMVVWQSFHATANRNAVFIGTATAAVLLPSALSAGNSSYLASKLGLIKFLEVLASEEQDISVRFLHPGVIETEMTEKGGMRGKLPADRVDLPAHFTVWLASPEAAFTAGRMVSCNWDIDALKTAKDKLPKSELFRTTLQGFSGPDISVSLNL
ncbi:uncharacterized protein PV09_04712 [Verruconis gallopava]|uniref:Uncharacterized protein n=1 Tax=Verruconis gallopava TaxID=253628 RepID=A0A0D1XPG0_9PEZI|nr:uncharacterized protein PV09_04712 [Verruconis gallopava]KIW04446.1 hypothetical protein PV09_04712 [Verruconis gallopava]